MRRAGVRTRRHRPRGGARRCLSPSASTCPSRASGSPSLRPATRCASPDPSTPPATPATSCCSRRWPTTGELPHGLAGADALLRRPHAGGRRPTRSGSVGPTTAKRMDAATPALLRAGIVATIGKGARSEAVRAAFAETGSVYFARRRRRGGAARHARDRRRAGRVARAGDRGARADDARGLPGVRRDRRARQRPVRGRSAAWRPSATRGQREACR